MTPFVAPRRFTRCSGLLDAGLPRDGGARAAARHAFEELKRRFLDALEGLPGAGWLSGQMRMADEPIDLWLLRAPVFTALQAAGPKHASRHALLRREVDSTFPDQDAGAPAHPY